MKNIFLFLVLLGNILVQDKIPYDVTKVTTKKELNFYHTDKRGIKYKDVVYYVENDLNVITAYQQSGKLKWKVNFTEKFTSEVIGERKIRYINIDKDKLHVTYTKHDYFEIDLKTGKLFYWGSD
ncbi:hypothetical protein [Flavobacterium sp. AG291]|uniref:hypothetical protein n=1 Tax=Flavobacterium sp. AG291 TaxID=2184000 RepID=UPI000E0A7023|nr:hypothetical protein [Flavobacterium sp. AG291]RDI10264.1 hypothetical protein DEU42_10881 [Flavobacterium sp. AG291]